MLVQPHQPTVLRFFLVTSHGVCRVSDAHISTVVGPTATAIAKRVPRYAVQQLSLGADYGSPKYGTMAGSAAQQLHGQTVTQAGRQAGSHLYSCVHGPASSATTSGSTSHTQEPQRAWDAYTQLLGAPAHVQGKLGVACLGAYPLPRPRTPTQMWHHPRVSTHCPEVRHYPRVSTHCPNMQHHPRVSTHCPSAVPGPDPLPQSAVLSQGLDPLSKHAALPQGLDSLSQQGPRPRHTAPKQHHPRPKLTASAVLSQGLDPLSKYAALPQGLDSLSQAFPEVQTHCPKAAPSQAQTHCPRRWTALGLPHCPRSAARLATPGP